MAAAEWSERTRMIITVALVVALNAGVWGFAYKARGDWQAEVKKLQWVTKKVNQLTKVVEQKEAKSTRLRQLESEAGVREKKLPQEHHRDTFMVRLTELAQANRMVDLGVQMQYSLPIMVPGIKNPRDFTRDLWKTKWRGDFKGVVTYLNELEEKHEHFIAIENLNIVTSNQGMNVTGVKHDVTFDVETYRYVRKK